MGKLNFFLVYRSSLTKREIWRIVPLERNLNDRNEKFRVMLIILKVIFFLPHRESKVTLANLLGNLRQEQDR